MPDSPPLSFEVRECLVSALERLRDGGTLLRPDELEACYLRFRDRFGPERLAVLDGEELLNTIHLHGNRDRLVYRLEFKDDDELPGVFGSIAGGSALKFRIYMRKETGDWTTQDGLGQRSMSVEEAVQVAPVAGAAV